MDYANKNGGFVIGTGDLSELARLGHLQRRPYEHVRCQRGRGAKVETLVRHIVQYAADTCGDKQLSDVLLDILDTPVSPELLPTAEDGTIAQADRKAGWLLMKLHDFYLYYVLRFGFDLPNFTTWPAPPLQASTSRKYCWPG